MALIGPNLGTHLAPIRSLGECSLNHLFLLKTTLRLYSILSDWDAKEAMMGWVLKLEQIAVDSLIVQ